MSYSKNNTSFFWPMLLIAGGIILLLSNFGMLPPVSMVVFWRFWPLLLVIAGLDILLGRRSQVGAVLTIVTTFVLIGLVVLAVFFWTNNPALVKEFVNNQMQHQTVSAPLGSVTSAAVTIDLPAGPTTISALSDSASLIEGDISYFGTLTFDTTVVGNHATVKLDSRGNPPSFNIGDFSSGDFLAWDVKLHPRVTLDLMVDAGAGQAEIDLRRLDVRTLTIDAGSGAMALTLPEAGRIAGMIDAGSGRIDITVPETLAAKIVLETGSGAFEAGSRFRRDAAVGDREVWVTEGFSTADHAIELNIEQSSGAIFVK